MHECSCMTCNHPACQFKGKSDHYCGNYMMSKPYTLKLVLGGTEVKRSESEKDRVCVSPSNSNCRNSGTGYNDNIADT